MSRHRRMVRVAASAVVVGLCWAGSSAVGAADRGSRGDAASSPETSRAERAARGARSADSAGSGAIRARRLPASTGVGADPSPGPAGNGTPGDSGQLGDLTGVPEADAATAAAGLGYTVRVVARDGEWFPVTKDYRENRINLVVDDGVVTSTFIG